MKLKAQLFCLICIFSKDIYAQVGIGTINPNPNSLLDLASTDKGLLIPRVSLIATDSPLPLSEDVAGMIVYNTATVGTGINSVTPGFYVNDGTNWIRANTDADSKWVYKPGSVELMYLSDGSIERPVGSEFVALDNGNVGIGLKTPLENLHVNGSFVTQNKITDENSDVYTTGFYSGDSLYGSELQGTALISLKGDDVLDLNTDSFSLVSVFPEQIKIGVFEEGAIGSLTGSYGELNVDTNEARLWIEDRGNKRAVLSLNAENNPLFDISLDDLVNNNSTSIKYESGSRIEFSFQNNNVHSSYKFPRTDGSNGQVLTSNGSGELSWSRNTDFVIDDNGHVGVGAASPSEKVEINGAVKIGDGGYTGISDGASSPVPTGGAGTMVFSNNHFYGWNGSAWKQLDN